MKTNIFCVYEKLPRTTGGMRTTGFGTIMSQKMHHAEENLVLHFALEPNSFGAISCSTKMLEP